jgi:hypothetical protein
MRWPKLRHVNGAQAECRKSDTGWTGRGSWYRHMPTTAYRQKTGKSERDEAAEDETGSGNE